MKSKLYVVQALSALHVGIGQAIGSVDLPIARERSTNFPHVPGSGVKGVLRDTFRSHGDAEAWFGPAKISDAEQGFAGALTVSDARLLLLPVRSLAGVMAWATCPFVLRRYVSDLSVVGGSAPEVPDVASGRARVTGSVLKLDGDAMVIDDLDLRAEGGADDWAKHLCDLVFATAEAEKHFVSRVAILSDDDFSFLAETATEVRTRIRIDDATGTVMKGQLWSEENLPAETVLWGLMGIGASRRRDAYRDAEELSAGFFGQLDGAGKVVQLGGKATVGRGLIRIKMGATNS